MGHRTLNRPEAQREISQRKLNTQIMYKTFTCTVAFNKCHSWCHALWDVGGWATAQVDPALPRESCVLKSKGVYHLDILHLVFAESGSLPPWHKLPGKHVLRKQDKWQICLSNELIPSPPKQHPFQLPVLRWENLVCLWGGALSRGVVGFSSEGWQAEAGTGSQGHLIQLGNFSIRSLPDSGFIQVASGYDGAITF